jgi:hypothetical protein
MHNAPSVTYPVGRCAFHGWLIVVLALAGLTCMVLWWVLWNARLLSVLFVGAVWLAALIWAVWRGWLGQAHQLCWQQGCWTLDGLACSPVLMLDAGAVLLVSCRVWGRGDHPLQRHWLWLQRGMAPVLWSDLRRALYSRADTSA